MVRGNTPEHNQVLAMAEISVLGQIRLLLITDIALEVVAVAGMVEEAAVLTLQHQTSAILVVVLDL